MSDIIFQPGHAETTRLTTWLCMLQNRKMRRNPFRLCERAPRLAVELRNVQHKVTRPPVQTLTSRQAATPSDLLAHHQYDWAFGQPKVSWLRRGSSPRCTSSPSGLSEVGLSWVPLFGGLMWMDVYVDLLRPPGCCCSVWFRVKICVRVSVCAQQAARWPTGHSSWTLIGQTSIHTH